jgi:predicted ester cyclase
VIVYFIVCEFISDDEKCLSSNLLLSPSKSSVILNISNSSKIKFSNHHFLNHITGTHIAKLSKAESQKVSKNLEGIKVKSDFIK